MKRENNSKEPLAYVSPCLVATVCLLGAGYYALRCFLSREWGRGVHNCSEEA